MAKGRSAGRHCQERRMVSRARVLLQKLDDYHQAYSFVMPKMTQEDWRNLKASVTRMETTLAGMQELRQYIKSPDGLKKLDETITQAEKQLAELKRMVVN